MPITLVTGLPGHGKTLYALSRFQQMAEKEGRKVFHNDIPGLAIPGWERFDFEKWHECPAGSLLIVDECQKPLPVRGRDKPPKHIEDLATHRHLGLDFVLITQNPMQFDGYVRRLVDRHFHVVRKFGTQWATIHEFTTGANESVARSRAGSIRHEFRYPKEVFDWYKSAELHTVKRRIPMRIWLLLSLPFIIGALSWFVWSRLNPHREQEPMAKGLGQLTSHASPGVVGYSGAPAAYRQRGDSLTPSQYASQYTARIQGLPHTAPAYDEVTKPAHAPYPAACIQSAKRCGCYSQQGTRLSMPDQLCRSLADGGFFVAWQLPEQRQAVATETQHPEQLHAAAEALQSR